MAGDRAAGNRSRIATPPHLRPAARAFPAVRIRFGRTGAADSPTRAAESPVRRVVVDASVLLAGLFKIGTVRDLLLTTESCFFSAPDYLQSEVHRHLFDVSLRSQLSAETVRVVLEDLLSQIELAPFGLYAHRIEEARRVMGKAHAPEDVDYVALALSLDAPIWTLDNDFRRMSRVATLTTRELERALLEGASRTTTERPRASRA